METVFRSVSNSFRLGEHFSENLVDRREVDSVWNYDPDSVCLKTVHIDNQGTRSSLIIIFFKFRVQGLQRSDDVKVQKERETIILSEKSFVTSCKSRERKNLGVVATCRWPPLPWPL